MIRIHRPDCPDPAALRKNYKHPPNKNVLRAASHDKCMYCESKISHVDFGDVEHIQPKALFPEQEFVWTNLGYVCSKCNGNKSNQWNADLPYINPYVEEPAEHVVALGMFVQQKGGSLRGEYTIRVIGLNRADLLERRKERIDAISVLIDKALRTHNISLRDLIMDEIRSELNDDKPYTMTSRSVFDTLVPDNIRNRT
jgi:hypothetical protein